MANHNYDSFTLNIAGDDNFNLNDYCFQTTNILNKNLHNCLNSSYVINKEGVFAETNFKNKFAITGSFIINKQEELGVALKYFQKEGRLRLGGTGKNKAFYTRGYRYIVALDPNLSVLQKLKVLFEDIDEGMDFIIQNEVPQQKQYFMLSPVLDYIKNALITLYNAYTHKEKLGILDLDKVEYQTNKRQLLELTKEAVFAYYSSLLNKFSYENLMNLLESFDSETLSKIELIIQKDYRDFTFSSRAIARPEASHPLILAGFAYNVCKKYPNTDIVIGLPSGGTELACLVHECFRYFYHRQTELILLPISTHTTKDSYGLSESIYNRFGALFDKIENISNYNFALLIDDNSATGKSLEIAKKIILKTFKNIILKFGVAEADIIRIKQNIEDGKKEIANNIVFNNSISILPITKRTHRKNDLKEMIESHVLSQYYFRKSISADNIIDKIRFEIISEAISEKIERFRPQLNKSNAIIEFKHTYFSNFYYAKPIIYNNFLYSTVEHAYLDQKYKTELLSTLNSSQKHQLNEVFRIKGLAFTYSDFSKIFKDDRYPAGVVKRISNIINNWNIQVDNWENKRLRIMIELQLIKYSNPIFRNELLKTGNKYLLEGNTWNDTYWGFCDNRGKNFLGRILMKVRYILSADST